MKVKVTESQLRTLIEVFKKKRENNSISVKRIKELVSEDAVKDDPKKADLVKDDLADFYKTLEEAIKKGGLSQQSRKDLSFQKEVESLQIGLMLLGYTLPKHGVDGLFGPETAAAVDKFTKENVKEGDEKKKPFLKRLLNISEGRTTVGPFSTDLENGPKNHSGRAFGNWQSDNAWDMFAPAGTQVNSLTKGTVSSIRESGSGNSKVFGTQVSVKGESGFPDIFYTHIENVRLKKGDSVDIGDYIGTIKQWPKHDPKMNHVHIGLPRGRHIKELLANSDKIFTGSGKVITPSGDEDNSGGEGNENPSNIKATPEMITKLIQMLKSKNIKSKDIKSLIDSSTGGSFDFSGPAVTGNVILKGNFDSVQKQNISLLIDEMKKNGITNPYTQIGILSVVSKESNFRPKGEQSYANTSNSRIRKIFGSRVAKYSDAELDQLKKNPKDFFNVVYAKTVGNQGGDDGWIYRGRGFNQLTGIKNYEKYGRMAGMGDDLVKNPTLLDDPKISAKVALAFFTKGKSGSSFPNFNNKEDAAKYFADINSGGGVSSHRDSALAAAIKFDAKDNLA